MAASGQLSYIASDVPEGMHLGTWRAATAPRRKTRRVAPMRIRPLSALDSRLRLA